MFCICSALSSVPLQSNVPLFVGPPSRLLVTFRAPTQRSQLTIQPALLSLSVRFRPAIDGQLTVVGLRINVYSHKPQNPTGGGGTHSTNYMIYRRGWFCGVGGVVVFGWGLGRWMCWSKTVRDVIGSPRWLCSGYKYTSMYIHVV